MGFIAYWNFEINLSIYMYFQVLLARHKTEEKVFAVKVLQKQAIMKRNEVKHIMSERNVLLKNVQHPFLVGLHYSFQTPDKLYFVLDYVNGGEVSSQNSPCQKPCQYETYHVLKKCSSKERSTSISSWSSLLNPDSRQTLLCFRLCEWRRGE